MVKILVVDDDIDIVLSVKKGLTNNGFEVDGYNEPQKALSDFKPNVYDLLLIDFRMPEMNGFELYREIRKKQESVKVCFLSAFEMYYDEFRKIFPTLDVQCFIRKPTTTENLVSHIKSELNL
ncbi:MAG TPA: response regulator [Candidatus Nitrosotalea sp.]|nr:response regulator [Candidatus Nitrosotalea sp.]